MSDHTYGDLNASHPTYGDLEAEAHGSAYGDWEDLQTRNEDWDGLTVGEHAELHKEMTVGEFAERHKHMTVAEAVRDKEA